MKKIVIVLAILFSTTVAFAQKSNSENKELTKFEQISSQTGRIVKFQDVKTPNISLSFGGFLRASIRLVMGDKDSFFYRIEKPETSSSISRIAMIEYSDLVEINKALVTLSASVDSDLQANPDYLENKFRTEDGLEVGYYISNGKANWFIKLERYSNSTVFPKNQDEIINSFSEAQTKIEELKSKRD